ncbi:hypothetical protein J132_04258 [Termitomyces sp. J132]|nr:hypothetical protein H2248_005631 [Termitomyces sp. 'cryptogamus']KNZ80829.1 hypothetical protein J132_04258 [Termitomyces sp. J132]
MHVARQKRNHARIGRSHIPLQARAPALITLPISMPSIPLLGPLITPLIAGTNINRPATMPSTPTPTPVRGTTLTPAPTDIPASVSTPTPTPPVGDNGGNNPGDGGRSNDGSSPTSGSIDEYTSVVNIGGSTIVAPGTSTGSSPQSTDTSGNVSTGRNESANGSSGNSASNSSTTNGNSLNGSNVSGSINNVDGSVGDANDVNSVGTANSPGSGSIIGGSIIGGNTDTAISKATASSVRDFPGSTAFPDPNGVINTRSPASNDVRRGLPGGAIAGMVIVITLGLLAVIVILLRGRYRQRRSERRNQWWSGFRTRLGTGNDSTATANPSDRVSFRSSFETTIDHARTPRLNISFDTVPSLPPMAEIRGSNNIQLFSPNSAISSSPILITFDNSQAPAPNNRTSMASSTSNSSGAHYLIVPSGLGDDREASSPVSVRPFSPSESFAFPMPPKTQSGDWSSSRPMSTATVHSTSRSLTNGTVVVPALPPNPFVDPFNPFSDPVSPTVEFAEVESIKRPFISTRHDELTVITADSVKVLRLFDDGWAFVEKLPAFEDILTHEGKNIRAQGFIPVDCFRAAGQDLSTCFSEKRVSSALHQGHANLSNAVTAK